jgi:hypothetical protein
MLPSVIKQTQNAVPQHRIKKPQTQNKEFSLAPYQDRCQRKSALQTDSSRSSSDNRFWTPDVSSLLLATVHTSTYQWQGIQWIHIHHKAVGISCSINMLTFE